MTCSNHSQVMVTTASCPCISGFSSRMERLWGPEPLCLIYYVFKPWHIPMVLGDLRHLWVTGMSQIKFIIGSF